MLKLYRTFLLSLLVFGFAALSGQDFPPEDICVPFGQGLITNVIEDNVPLGGDEMYQTSTFQTECFFLDPRGNLFFADSAREEFCCGPQQPFFVEVFRIGPDGGQEFIGVQEVNLTIKCLKPDCGLVDLEEFVVPRPDPGNENPEPAPCVPACENSTATYLFNQDLNFSYDWMAGNGSATYDPGLPGQVTISWGPLGPSSISVDIYDQNGNLVETRVWCVELAPAPVADFTAVTDACLDQDVYFTNTSSGAPATYDWDFGDGNTAQNVTNPSHAYDTPGTYTVTLYATSTNINPDGSDGCCCTDSVSYDIVIDPLPGPGIFWISTLCEDDSSKYWTDATGCTDIEWTVSANGTITSGQGTDTIMVDWGAGPAGTITLEVDGCDQDYCPTPSTAVVPIISTNGTISGPVAVCKGETASYELPKWMTVEYNWATSDAAAVINGGNGGHIVNVTWPTVPGTYQLTVNYGSDFLNGLPNHGGDDCYGSAVIEVTVLGDFTISATPNPVCDGTSTFLQGFSDIGPTSYNWSVAGNPGLSSTGPNASILFPGPGAYSVSADVVNPADYCVGTRTITVVVKKAIDPVITGPADYCVGEPVVFTVPSPGPGYNYFWTPTGGTVMTGQGGPIVTVVFTVTTGASLSVVGTDGSAPFCTSNPAVVNPVTKDFIGNPMITGPEPCTNSQAVYGITVPQHVDATYSWSVSPITAGSVVADAETPSPTINWNNVPSATPVTITLDIELCGQVLTLMETLTLNVPVEPLIVQVGDLCPSGSAVLQVNGALFSSVTWSPGGPGASITITSPGNYVVNTVDLNGCPGVDRITVEEVDGPEVSLGLNGANSICVNSPPWPANPTLTASTAAANTIEWFCNGNSQGPAATGNNTFTHIWNDTIKTYGYTVVVTDPNGCTTMPDPLFVYQQPCCDTPYVSQPLAQNHTFTAINRSPECDIIDLVATWSADSVDCHAWDLPQYTTVLGGGGDPVVANDSLSIRLPGVGCFKLESEIFRWAYDYDTTTVIDPVTGISTDIITKEDSIKCGDALLITVCNPLLAEFDYSEDCEKVSFFDESKIDPTLTTGSVTYTWDFGDGSGTFTGPNPMHTFPANGTYTVTLVVSDDVCESTFIDVVTVENVPDSDFTFSPNPVCYGKPVTFNGTGIDIIRWTWDFGNGASFVGNDPDQTFLPPGGSGTSVITLITENSAGCLDTVTQTITINPNPDTVMISASNGLIICDGETTTLSVPFAAGHAYLWSTGATGNSITVGTAGTYGLTITNSFGCETVIDPVEVQVIPLPDASWFGNPFICDNGSTTLTAVAGGGHTYQWNNLTTGAVVTTRVYNVPFFPGPPEQDIILTVTNDFGCKAQSSITVKQVDSPAPVLAITGGECEGDGSTITVTNPEPGVVYTWNTGETGLSIFTYQSGAYTVLATNTETGCTGTAIAIINPLPDLCLVPTGCYEACLPDTLYAPIGNYTYQWNDANGPIFGATGSSYIVGLSGVYTVKVTDIATGCMATSDSLYLEIIDCDDSCENLTTKLSPVVNSAGEEECCFELLYDGLPSGVYAIRVSSTDATLSADPGSVNPALGYAANADPFTLEFAVNATLSIELPPSMAGPPVAVICPDDYLTSPQVIVVEYLDQLGDVVCADTLETFCEPEPECVFIASDTLYCSPNGQLILDFTICVPSDQEFSVGYIQLLDASTEAEIDLPYGMSLSPALLPGECRSLSLTLSDLTPGEEFCYTLVGHTGDPELDPTALCCSIQEEFCHIIPDCDPCDDLGVSTVDSDEVDCCYDIVLFENAADYDFNAIDLCLISGDASLSIFTSLGDDLTGVVSGDGKVATITSADGGILPEGILELPTLCLNEGNDVNYQLEIKWIDETGVRCRDTISLFCEPDCGYLEEELVTCEEDHYLWQGNIVNTSDYPMGEAHIHFPVSSGLSAYDTTIVFGSAIPPGGAAFVGIEIGNPAGPGDTICFTVGLHELNDDDDHLNCCNFEACIIMPDCTIDKCACEDLRDLVQEGVDSMYVGPGPRDYLLSPAAQLAACDEIRWRIRKLNPTEPWVDLGTDYTQEVSFTDDRLYQVAMIVTRTNELGEECPRRSAFPRYDFRNGFTPGGDTALELFPNPTAQDINLRDDGNGYKIGATIELYDTKGKRVRTYPAQPVLPGEVRKLDLKGLAPGLYLLRGQGEDGVWAKRFIVN